MATQRTTFARVKADAPKRFIVGQRKRKNEEDRPRRSGGSRAIPKTRSRGY